MYLYNAYIYTYIVYYMIFKNKPWKFKAFSALKPEKYYFSRKGMRTANMKNLYVGKMLKFSLEQHHDPIST